MPELPKPRTWIIAPDRTFAEVEEVANAEASANGWAAKVERVIVDGQDAALVIFSERADPLEPLLRKESADGDRPIHPAAMAERSGLPWEDLIGAYRSYMGVSRALKTATLAQWILESGRGTSVLAREHLNFGGLKFRARMSGRADPVDYRGSDGELTTYCKFLSIGAFIKGYWHFIDSGPYDGWRDYAEDGAGYIRHIAKNGYAPGTEYSTKVLALFEEAGRLLGQDAPGEPPSPVPGSGGTERQLRFAIVVGHNKVAKGAQALSPISKSEYDFNSVVGGQMSAEGGHYNLETKVFFRQPGLSYSREIASTYEAVASWGAECAVELHFNSATPDARGTEVLCRQGSAEAHVLASHIAEEIHRALGFDLRHGGNGVKIVGRGERGAGSLYALDNVPTVIVEPFFGSNPTECLKVAAFGEQVLALSYLRGVRDWVTARTA
jgi:hypothetical protein